jgi:hypothetical protein
MDALPLERSAPPLTLTYWRGLLVFADSSSSSGAS